MPTYTVAQAKDNLSRLIDEALEGNPVTITRHGKPVVRITPMATEAPKAMTDAEIDRLARFRATQQPLPISTAEIVRAMRDED